MAMRCSSFNPCFSGMAFGTTEYCPAVPTPSSFNPCFSGMAFGTSVHVTPSGTSCSVSILVFLEWPLGPLAVARGTGKIDWFQSLFFWNGLWDSVVSRAKSSYTEFQSLFFWNGLWDTQVAALTTGQSIMFQSLFFWNGLWDDGLDVGIYRRVRFQSLFFWNGLWDAVFALIDAPTCSVSILVFLEWPLGLSIINEGPEIISSFNPCFSGMAFGTAKGGLDTSP